MFSKLGTEVALEMEQILSSDAHADLFYKQAKAEKADTKCDCAKNCACKQDGECKGACPCDKSKCDCPKGCDDCDCTETAGKCPCTKKDKDDKDDKKDNRPPWLKDKKNSDALQDLSYTFSKISVDLDDAGYVKSSIAVMRTLEGLIAEAQPADWKDDPDAARALHDEFGVDDPEFEKYYEQVIQDRAERDESYLPAKERRNPNDLTQRSKLTVREEDLPMPDFGDTTVPHPGRGIMSDEADPDAMPERQMSLQDIGTGTMISELEEAIDLLEEGKPYEGTEMVDMIADVVEEDKADPKNLPSREKLPPPTPVEDLKQDELPQYRPMEGNTQEGSPEGVGLGELKNVFTESELELDKWLQKNASAVHRVDDPRDPELNIDLDLKDLLTAEDGVDTNLIDAYLSELEFEDE